MSSQYRLQPLPPDQLSPEQKKVYDEISKGIVKTLDDKHSFVTHDKNGALLGPFNAWVHEPVVGGAMWYLSNVMFKSATLPQNLRQICILTVGAHFKASYEIYAHSGVAKHNFGDAQVEMLANGECPEELLSEEKLVHRITKSLVQGGPLSDDLYNEGVQAFGQKKVMELIFLVGLYALVSMCLNGFNVPVPTEA